MAFNFQKGQGCHQIRSNQTSGELLARDKTIMHLAARTATVRSRTQLYYLDRLIRQFYLLTNQVRLRHRRQAATTSTIQRVRLKDPVLVNLVVSKRLPEFGFMPDLSAFLAPPPAALGWLEIHYTPKHGSWLNMAEIELSVLNNQGLEDRIADLSSMHHQTAAWTKRRNASQNKIDWRFTNKDARIKLKRFYPKL